MAVNAAVRLAQAKRRETVSQLYLRHITQPQIAAQLRVDKSTVSRDVKYLIEQWRERAQGPIAQWVAQELAEIDQMEADAAMAYATTKDRQWVETRLHIKDRRAALLGLDAPKRIEASGPDGAPISIAALLFAAQHEAGQVPWATMMGAPALVDGHTDGHSDGATG